MMDTRRTCTLCLIGLVLAGPVRCSRGAVDREVQKPVRHVILIVVDTLRADAIGPRTPSIEKLASQSIVFGQARAPSSWTLPSMSSIMTGLPPSVHLVYTPRRRLPANLPTMASHLREKGFHTAAAGVNIVVNPRTKLNRGFLEYNFPVHSWFDGSGHPLPDLSWMHPGYRKNKLYTSTPHVEAFASGWIPENRGRDFFLYLHFLDPHLPYYPPDDFKPQGEKPRGVGMIIDGIEDGGAAATPEQRKWVKELYMGEVQAVDAAVGRIIDLLKEHGIYDEALVVLTSDHGEEFWEHDGFEHGHSLLDEVVHVPLIVKLPASLGPGPGSSCKGGGGAPAFTHAVVDKPVSVTGIAPMVMRACGVGDYDPLLDQYSIAPYTGLADPQETPSPVFLSGILYGDYREAVVMDGLKYIYKPGKQEEQLFDLAADPAENLCLADHEPEDLVRLRNALQKHKELAVEIRKKYEIDEKGEAVQFNKKTVEKLREMGYIY